MAGLSLVECPQCQCGGRAIHGFNNNGTPRLGGPCARCHAAGFVPLLDGEPSYPFGKDKNHPVLVAHAVAHPVRREVEPQREQKGLL